MKSFIKGLVIILLFHRTTANLLTEAVEILTSTTEEVSSSITSLLTEISNITASDVLSSLSITESGVVNLYSLLDKLDFDTTNITNILTALNVTVSDDGLVDLNNVFENFNLTNINFTDVLSLLGVSVSDGVLDLTSLAEKLTNVSLEDYIDTLYSELENTTEDANLDFIGLAEKYIGNVTQYNVTTEDGYILQLFHIPGDGDVTLISHGLLSSSDDFITRGNISVIYTLAQNGSDIWAMNYRGNRYSRRHTTLDPDTDAEFWDFSMQELGYYDLSAVIDFILNTTGKTELSVVGHSEGTTAAFVLTSTRPEYNDKIKVFIAMSPVCYLSHTGAVLKSLINAGPVLYNLLKTLGINELFGFNSLTRKSIQLFCSQGTVGYDVCLKVVIFSITGYNPDNLGQEIFLTTMGHFPAGTSTKNVNHYLQIGKSGRFAQYDYGSSNEEYYGTETPPLYDLTNVTCKVVMFMGANDLILGLEDAERLKGELSNVGGYYVVDDALFNHVDFVYGENAHEILYPILIDELNAYN